MKVICGSLACLIPDPWYGMHSRIPWARRYTLAVLGFILVVLLRLEHLVEERRQDVDESDIDTGRCRNLYQDGRASLLFHVVDNDLSRFVWKAELITSVNDRNDSIADQELWLVVPVPPDNNLLLGVGEGIGEGDLV